MVNAIYSRYYMGKIDASPILVHQEPCQFGISPFVTFSRNLATGTGHFSLSIAYTDDKYTNQTVSGRA